MRDRVILDTNLLIDGIPGNLLDILRGKEILIPRVVILELKHMLDTDKYQKAKAGFSELERLKGVVGFRVVEGDLKIGLVDRIRSDVVDRIIIEIAKKENATIITKDQGIYYMARIEDVDVVRMESDSDISVLDQLFTENTMSVHIKIGNVFRKVGNPSDWRLERVDVQIHPEHLIDSIERYARAAGYGYEVYHDHLKIIQLGRYRIVITTPPLSDNPEITVVRSIRKMDLEEYRISKRLVERLDSSTGLLIAGAPGSGKSTFAAALSNHYNSKGRIVKTIEQPRDMLVDHAVTQYSKNSIDLNSLRDVLLLVRPDHVVFDEIRTPEDFGFYSDLRLAGIGMVGVVHANRAIDAIHRFVNRLELGLLPHVIDTVIFIDRGKVEEVYSLSLTVRVPTGIQERDLARPIVEIRNFETGRLMYEIYKFSDEVVLMEVGINNNLDRILSLYSDRIRKIGDRYYLFVNRKEYRKLRKYIELLESAGYEIVEND
ncbi:MAG: ATPase, T2SS/T4P/T4SS family [Candidatus Micrarchaeota archaeon]|nr:ATPase, T2SS/T4P/T4SS family [Candidatus Micrarchaeota archaeon]MCX8154423.1 ATPase, T2SS/T4P/T4SS family [Candidatus Micrarchaeota archaeon]